MAFIALPNGIKVEMEFTKNGQLVVNIFYVTTGSPVTTLNLTALAQIFLDWWTTDLDVTQSAALALSRITATFVGAPDGLQVILNGAGAPGTIAGADTPNNVAVVVSHRTGFSGRSRRGRTYLAGIVASDVVNDLTTPAKQAAYVTAFNALRTDLATAGYTMVVASYFSNGAPRLEAISTPITSHIVDARVDTQRRRLTGQGE